MWRPRGRLPVSICALTSKSVSCQKPLRRVSVSVYAGVRTVATRLPCTSRARRWVVTASS